MDQFEQPVTVTNSYLLNSPSWALIDSIVSQEQRLNNVLTAWGVDTPEELDELMTDWLK